VQHLGATFSNELEANARCQLIDRLINGTSEISSSRVHTDKEIRKKEREREREREVYGIVQRREDEAEAEIKYGKAEKAEYVIKDKIGVRGGGG